MFNILKPFIFKFNPETAHSMAIKALKYGYIPPVKIKESSKLETSIFSKKFILQLVLQLALTKTQKFITHFLIWDLALLKLEQLLPSHNMGIQSLEFLD